MAEALCGKNCELCEHREALACQGCDVVPCEIKRCIRSKNHSSCDTCTAKETCITLRRRDSQPTLRHNAYLAEVKRREYAEKARQEMLENAAILGKWLWLLFWLIIPRVLGGIMSLDQLKASAPLIVTLGHIITFLCSLAYGLILWKASAVCDRYRTAAICVLFSALCSAVLIPFESTEITWGSGLLSILLILTAVVSIIAIYQEFLGHAEVLEGIDNELSEKWSRLWKWYIACTAGPLACIVLASLAPLLGALLILGCAIGIIVVSIYQLIYLYRTANTFRQLTN